MKNVVPLRIAILCAALAAAAPHAPAENRQGPPTRTASERSAANAALRSAIDSGDVRAVRGAIASGADLNAINGFYTPVVLSLFRQKWEIASLLIDLGARTPTSNKQGCRQMGCEATQAAAFASRHAPTLAMLKKRGLDLDAADSDGRTPLAIVISECPMRIMAVRQKGREAPAPLVIEPDNAERVRNLLAHGADPNRKIGPDTTPLMLAVSTGVPKEVGDALVAHGAKVEAALVVERSAQLGDPPDAAGALLGRHQGELTGLKIGPLTWLALKGRPDLAVAMLKRDRAIGAYDRDIVYFAAARGDWDLVLAALAHGANGHASNRADVSALMYAANAGRPDVVGALLAAGAEVNMRSDRNWAPIFKGDLIPALLSRQSPPPLVGGYTALDIALRNGDAESAALLRAAGAR